MYIELEGLPIELIDFSYYDFRVREFLLDPLAGGNVFITLKNGEYWIFNVTGIDVQSVRHLKDAQINLMESIPDELRKYFQFQWKRALNTNGHLRDYCLVSYEFLPTFYNKILKRLDIKLMSDEVKGISYFRISEK